MLNYKRLTFVFLFTTVFLLATDSQAERDIRRSLLSFFGIVTEEGSQLGQSAPGSLIDTAESIRTGTYNFLNKQAQVVSVKANVSKGPLSMALSIAYYVIAFFKFLASYVITFYPFVLFLFYMFFTSRFFRRDDFASEDF
jgi:hypothetical protein